MRCFTNRTGPAILAIITYDSSSVEIFMQYRVSLSFAAVIALSIPSIHAGETASSARDALSPFNPLIGKWNAAGVPEGTSDEKQKGHWSEVMNWSWRFKGDDACLVVLFDKGKYYKSGELRHDAKNNSYNLHLETTDNKQHNFTGTLKNREVSFERIDEKSKETQRLIFSLFHSNRIVYRFEIKPADKTFFTKVYRVGATKDGEPLVGPGSREKECVVSGGLGVSTVVHEGKTYYVCCSGCREAFLEEPEKYIKEFEKRRAKKSPEANK